MKKAVLHTTAFSAAKLDKSYGIYLALTKEIPQQ